MTPDCNTGTPGSLKHLKDSLAKAAFGTAESRPDHCRRCNQPFSRTNVFTSAGWAETRISGICEKCWDSLFAEIDE